MVAIPISLVGAVFLMAAAGFTINLLTLLAIVLSVGLVVDDAIVMVENVERHLHEGKPPLQAALVAARELVGPIVAMTITLAAVYAPVGLQGGLTGALFREFAFTLAGAVIVSGVVALTLSPMMSSRLLRSGDSTAASRASSTAASTPSARATPGSSPGRSGTGPSVLALWAIVVVLAVPFYMFSQKELAPMEDQGVVFGYVQASPNSTLDQTMLYTTKIYDVYKSFPETGNTFQITSPSGGLRGHGHEALERAEEDHRAAPPGVVREARRHSRGARDSAHPRAPARRRRLPRGLRGRLDRRAAAARRDRGASSWGRRSRAGSSSSPTPTSSSTSPRPRSSSTATRCARREST